MTEHIVAVFATEAPAAAAARDLQTAGIPASSIRHYRADAAGVSSGAATTATEPSYRTETSSQPSGGGFWAWLLGEEGPQPRTEYADDSELFDRRVQAGSTVLAVTVSDDSLIHRVIDIIESHDPLQIDERTEETAGGLSGGAGLAAGGAYGATSTEASYTAARDRDAMAAGTMRDMPAASDRTPDVTRGTPVTTENAGAPARAATADSSREETIPLAEEQLSVGKRTVDRGTTRIRRFVVETPVEKQVSLQGERVTVERRRPVEGSTPGAGAFEERVIEVRQTEEEPVVQKTAHVAEEVVVHREATERTETVRDTVRREQVEVEGNQTDAPTINR